jgi:antitoxin component HigA of HigAB toxin-antitoxin module
LSGGHLAAFPADCKPLAAATRRPSVRACLLVSPSGLPTCPRAKQSREFEAMDIRPIRNADDLAWPSRKSAPSSRTPPAKGTPEADRFDLIEAYEDRTFRIDATDPVDFLSALMAISGRTRNDLARLPVIRSPAERFGPLDPRGSALTIQT